MGWAKYAEDNYEIYLERMAAVRNNYARQQKAEIETKFSKENVKCDSFSQNLDEKSCFSLR